MRGHISPLDMMPSVEACSLSTDDAVQLGAWSTSVRRRRRSGGGNSIRRGISLIAAVGEG